MVASILLDKYESAGAMHAGNLSECAFICHSVHGKRHGGDIDDCRRVSIDQRYGRKRRQHSEYESCQLQRFDALSVSRNLPALYGPTKYSAVDYECMAAEPPEYTRCESTGGDGAGH